MSVIAIEKIARAADAWRDPDYPRRADAVARTLDAPNRFTEEAVAFAVNRQMHRLTADALKGWPGGRRATVSRRVGVIEAGRVPLDGLEDLLAVVLCGHRYSGAVAPSSPALLPAFVADVRQRAPSFQASFASVDDVFSTAEALIAPETGEAGDSIRERCDGQGIPVARRLLRKPRYAVAVLDGRETEAERDGLAEDALLHEGLGRRNVAVVWAPAGLSPDAYLESFAAFRGVFPAHPDTPGALRMQQAFLAAHGRPHAYGDGLEFLVSKGDPDAQGPGHVRWVEYEALGDVSAWLGRHAGDARLVVARPHVAEQLAGVARVASLGEAHRPAWGEDPDCVETVAFLRSL